MGGDKVSGEGVYRITFNGEVLSHGTIKGVKMKNKFEVGDKVIYGGRIAEIFGVANRADYWGERYAISFQYADGDLNNCVVRETDLQSAEIEVGDIVKFPNGNKGLVEHIAKKKPAIGGELALVDMIDTTATNTDYKLISTCVIELVEKGGN